MPGPAVITFCFGTVTRLRLDSGGRLIEESRQCREQSRAVERLAFPDHQHFPTECVKCRDVPSVPLHILFELLAPILGAGFWRRRSATPSMPMPETPVHEDHLSQTGKRQIRRARQVPAMEAKAVTQRVRHPANGTLRCRVLPADSTHQRRPHSRQSVELRDFWSRSRREPLGGSNLSVAASDTRSSSSQD